MIRTLIDPVAGVPRAVEGRRWVAPMLAVCAAVSFSGVAFAYRLDPAAAVISKMEESGELAKASERELGEEIDQAQRIALVGGAAKGVFVMPVLLLVLAVALKSSAWLIGRKLGFAQAFTVAAVAFLPVAVFHLLYGVVALEQPVVTAGMATDLLQSSLAAVAKGAHPRLEPALRQVDFFNLWSVALVGLGLSAGTKLRPARGLAVAAILYLALSVVMIGLPGLQSQGGQ